MELRALHSDVLRELAPLLGPRALLLLGTSCRQLSDTISGPAMSQLWVHFAGTASDQLLSSAATPKLRFLELLRVTLAGTWLDEGIDVVGKERYRFLSAVQEAQREGTCRTLKAFSQLEKGQLKISVATLQGHAYRCSERYVYERSGKLCSPAMNVAQGTLDLRDPQRPRVVGVWEQVRLPTKAILRHVAALEAGKAPPAHWERTTHGTFDWQRVSLTFDPRVWENPALREQAGMGSTSELYITSPLESAAAAE